MFNVVPLTLAVSLLLVAVFVYFFWREHSRHRFNSAESDALLPLADETPRIAGTSMPESKDKSQPNQTR